eukprot:c10406_g1_i1 orf=246-488(-)
MPFNLLVQELPKKLTFGVSVNENAHASPMHKSVHFKRSISSRTTISNKSRKTQLPHLHQDINHAPLHRSYWSCKDPKSFL